MMRVPETGFPKWDRFAAKEPAIASALGPFAKALDEIGPNDAWETWDGSSDLPGMAEVQARLDALKAALDGGEGAGGGRAEQQDSDLTTSAEDKPRAAIKLNGPGERPIMLGKHRIRPLGKKQYLVLKVLEDHFPDRVSLADLVRLSKVTGARNVLRSLRRSKREGEMWRGIIDMAGEEGEMGPGIGYRITDWPRDLSRPPSLKDH
jgi:hypothetical protein